MTRQIDCSKTGNLECLISQSSQVVFSKHDTLQWKHKGNSVYITIQKVNGSGETQWFLWKIRGESSQIVL